MLGWCYTCVTLRGKQHYIICWMPEKGVTCQRLIAHHHLPGLTHLGRSSSLAGFSHNSSSSSSNCTCSCAGRGSLDSCSKLRRVGCNRLPP